MPEIPPQVDTPAVMDRASYQASKAMLQARLSGEPYIGYAEMGRSAALAAAPVVAEYIARQLERQKVTCPEHPVPWLPRPSCWTCGRNGMVHRLARIARDAFTAGEPSEPEAPARASTPPYAEEKAVPGVVGSADDPISLETPTALREEIADRLLAEDARSWGYGMFEGSRNAALAVTDVMLAVRDDELEDLRLELGLSEKRGDHYAEKARQAEAAVARARRLCELTIAASIRVQAIDQARDTLAVLDQPATEEADRA